VLSTANLYHPYWSEEILGAALRNLVVDGGMTPQKAVYLEKQIRIALTEAIIPVTPMLLPCMPNHKGDRHVLATALIAKAHVIVTDNVRHFRPSDLEPFKIEDQSSDQFLTHLVDLFPLKMSQVIERQVNAMKTPPLNVSDFLGLLGRTVPTFASRISDIIQ